VNRELANLAQVRGNGIGHRLLLEDGVDLQAEREDGLLDAVVELGGGFAVNGGGDVRRVGWGEKGKECAE